MTVPWHVSDKILDSENPISFDQWKEIFNESSSIHLSGAVRYKD